MTKGKKSKFKWVMIGVSLVLMLAMAIFLKVLWSYLADFEKHTPQNVLLEYVGLLEHEEYDKAFAMAGFQENPQATAQGFRAYMQEVFREGYADIKVFDVTTNQSTVKEYEVYAENKKALKCSLSPTGESSRYGFPKFQMALLEMEEKEFVVTAPRNLRLFVNEQLQTPSEETVTIPELKLFDVMNDPKKRPTLQQYTIKSLFGDPVITAKRADGSEARIKVTKKEEQIQVSLDPDEDLTKEYCEKALAFAKGYAAFISTDVKLKTLAKDILKDTAYYKNLTEYYGGWYEAHSAHGYENAQASRLVLYGDDAFTVDTEFVYLITRNKKVFKYDTKYTVCYVKDNNEWKVANLVVR